MRHGEILPGKGQPALLSSYAYGKLNCFTAAAPRFWERAQQDGAEEMELCPVWIAAVWPSKWGTVSSGPARRKSRRVSGEIQNLVALDSAVSTRAGAL